MPFPNPADINASKGLPEFFSYANNVTYNWFSNMIIISIYMIILIGYGKATRDWIGASGVAGFGTFLISLLFYIGQLITGSTLAIVIAFAFIGALAVFTRQE